MGGGGSGSGSRKCCAGGPKGCNASWMGGGGSGGREYCAGGPKGLHRHHLIRVLCLFGSDPKFTRRQ